MQAMKVGLAGAGGMGAHLALECDALDEARIVAAADPSSEARENVRLKLGQARAALEKGAGPGEAGEAPAVPDDEAARAASDVRLYSDLREMLSSDLDGVIIAAPNDLHVDMVVAALSRGKHVFCEKPMALSVVDCDRMIAEARSADVTLVVGQVLRLIPVFWQSHKIATSGVIGQPFSINITRVAPWWFGPGWRSQKAHAGGVVFEVHVHELDFMRHVLGDAESVYATMGRFTGAGVDYEDTAFIQVRFKNGGVGALHGGISSSVNQYTMMIQCDKGTLVNEGFGRRIQYARFGEEHQIVEPESIVLEEPYRAEVASWVRHILHGEPLVFDATDGRAAVELAEAAYRSAASGEVVKLPL